MGISRVRQKLNSCERIAACHVREPFSHSYDSRTHGLPHTVGSTKKESARWSLKQRSANRVTHECDSGSLLASKGLRNKSPGRSNQENSCVHFWTTSTWFVSRTGCDRCTTSWTQHLHRHPCGVATAPRCWGPLWARHKSFRRWCRNGSQKNAGCGGPFPVCLTSSALGRSWSRVPTRGRTTPSERCHLLSRKITNDIPGSEQEMRTAEHTVGSVGHRPFQTPSFGKPCY